MPVLYRDYRPQTFAELISQEHVKTTLRNAVASGSFAHAYLFTGPRGTGKTSAARIFGRAINCLKQKQGEPCNSCEVCKSFLDGSSLDLTEIDAASNTGVENIRDIIEHLRFSPTTAKYKVFIIDEVHMLSKGAFNALLKTLEEPPQHAVFILATTEIHKVPATVISRTQRFDFRKISAEELAAHLVEIAKKEKIKIDRPSIDLIVQSSDGSVRDALSILDKLSIFKQIDLEKAEAILGLTNIISVQKFLDLLLQKKAAASVDFLNTVFERGIDPVQFNKDFLEYLRKVLMLNIGMNARFTLEETQQNTLQKHARNIHAAELLYIIRLFLKANKDFAIAPSADLPVQIAAVEACLATGKILAAKSAGLAMPLLEQTEEQDGIRKKSDEVNLRTSHQQSFKDSEDNDQQIVKQIVESITQTDNLVEKISVSERSAPLTENQQAAQIDFGRYPQLTSEQLQNAWPEILSSLKEKAGSLFTLMKNVTLLGVENNVVSLGCAYKFHKDSLEKQKNCDQLTQIINDLLQTKVMLAISLLAPGKKETSTTDNVALEVFGEDLI